MLVILTASLRQPSHSSSLIKPLKRYKHSDGNWISGNIRYPSYRV